ncbi:hypothetical protein VNO77_34822 [Canavalia gladiata]|uniref:Uncharacterized protein n=1 Tax=Canavalia gladiata TaxID=3824 RepID=A0AAN9PYR1_CANGL
MPGPSTYVTSHWWTSSWSDLSRELPSSCKISFHEDGRSFVRPCIRESIDSALSEKEEHDPLPIFFSNSVFGPTLAINALTTPMSWNEHEQGSVFPQGYSNVGGKPLSRRIIGSVIPNGSFDHLPM